MSFNIYHNLLIKASLKEVFDTVSQPEHLNNWWTLKSSGSPKLDSEYNLNFTEAYNWFGKVCKVKNNESFHLKMIQSDKDWNSTTLGFDLEIKDTSTLVKFSHVNWTVDNHHYRHSSFCWAMLLNGLKNYLEKDIIIPFDKRN
ncbi:SRPBCC family protein [Flavivirga jejuensis]|uniref:SRPBCC domain-containing protein n=1 Tax=Flavivirga jejuensis TaxID=870487 RepID=A0ABT8WW32_9FLAO|nr:SRPBCC domain-containing protein [Flavivirga jejuensis]MDO5977185.1 SRPBCC domain-containing protein [Flavivirga jejuensis]